MKQLSCSKNLIFSCREKTSSCGITVWGALGVRMMLHASTWVKYYQNCIQSKLILISLNFQNVPLQMKNCLIFLQSWMKTRHCIFPSMSLTGGSQLLLVRLQLWDGILLVPQCWWVWAREKRNILSLSQSTARYLEPLLGVQIFWMTKYKLFLLF